VKGWNYDDYEEDHRTSMMTVNKDTVGAPFGFGYHNVLRRVTQAYSHEIVESLTWMSRCQESPVSSTQRSDAILRNLCTSQSPSINGPLPLMALERITRPAGSEGYGWLPSLHKFRWHKSLFLRLTMAL